MVKWLTMVIVTGILFYIFAGVLTTSVNKIKVVEAKSAREIAEIEPYLDAVDEDGDGLSDRYELYKGTDPLKIDTDGDGCSDAREILQDKTDPLDREDLGKYCTVRLNTIRVNPVEYYEFIIEGIRYEIRYLGISSVEFKIKGSTYVVMYGESIQVDDEAILTIAEPSKNTGELFIYLE